MGALPKPLVLASTFSCDKSIQPKVMEGINKGGLDKNLQKTPSASSEASMQQEHPTSLILTDDKSKLLEISVEQRVHIDDSITLSPKVDTSEQPSSNEAPDDCPSSNEAFRSKEAQDDSLTIRLSENADCEASMQRGRPISLVPTINKSILQEVSAEENIPIGNSITLSREVKKNELPSTNEVPDGFLSSINEAYESKQDDLIATESSEVIVASQYLLKSREGVQIHAPHTDSDNVGCETPPAIVKKVKEDKNLFVHRLQKRQMSLADTREKVPAPVSRSVSAKKKNLRMDNTTVDTTTPIESVKIAASKFGGSINWKTRRSQPAQGNWHTVLELDKLKNEISECKHQAEAAEIATMPILDDLERTNKHIDELKHVLERKQAEEVDVKEDLEFYQFILQKIEGVVSGDSGMMEEKLKIIQERNKEIVTKFKLVKDESRKLQEDCDSLLIEQNISVRKAQEACTRSKETEREVEDLTLKLKRLKELLDLGRATLHDAEERNKEASILQHIGCSIWEVNLIQAEEELNKYEKLSSIEELKSELDTSSNLLLNLKNELATCTDANPTKEALEQKGGIYKSMEVIPPRNELEECNDSIAKVTNELCALKITAATLKSELNKEQAALAAMQQRETMVLMTVQSLKMEIKHSLQELEAVRAKAECRDGMVELPSVLQDAAWEADEAKSITTKAQEELRKTREEIEQTKASLSTMEFKLQAVLREIEATKESERLALNAIRAMENTKAPVNVEQGPLQMITVDLDKYTFLIEKVHRAEALVNERTAAAIAQVEAAKASKSQTLSRLDEMFKALEERKQAVLDATERADRATEGKLAVEQELRKWRESRQRCKASQASVSETRPSKAVEIIVEHSGDAKCRSKEDSSALVHPLSDTSGRSSHNGLILYTKTKKARKLSFFPRIIMFLIGRRRRKSLK